MLSSLAAKKRAYLKGHRSEWLAGLFLRCKGYELLKTRFKTPVGEIDLLVRHGRTLIAVEVKSRSSLEKALFSITPRQRRRIERALLYYLCHNRKPWSLRFDVVLIAPWTWPYHIKGAWREGER